MLPPHLTNGGSNGNGNGAAVAETGRSGGALVPVTHYPLAPAMPWTQMAPARPPALSAGPTPVGLLHCLRRRWLPAAGLGLLAGFVAALCTWLFAPLNSKVEAVVQIMRTPPTVMPGSVANLSKDPQEFDRFKNTQANVIVSHDVVQAALRRPGITQLGVVRAETDPTAWMVDEVKVFQPPQSEYMYVSMSGDRPEELVKVVNALVAEYVDYTNSKDRTRKGQQADKMRINVTKQKETLEQKNDQYTKLSKDLGALDKETAGIRSKLLFDQLAGHQRSVLEAASNLQKLHAQLADTDRMMAMQQQKALSEGDIDMALRQNPTIGPKMMFRDQLELELSSLAAQLKDPSNNAVYRQKQLQLQQAEDDLRMAKDQNKSVIEERIKGSTMAPLDFNKQSLEASIESYTKIAEESKIEAEKLKQQINQITDKSADLEGLKNEVEQEKATLNKMLAELSTLEVELDAPPRVSLVQEASAPLSIDRTLKFVIVGFFGFTGVALAMFGVSFLEFQSRRISDTQDVADGLGLRVVGSLPALRGVAKQKRGPSLHGLLSASVDGVRTALLHSAQTDGTRVVLVTSAGDREGRTTLASQLAASIARAGKRTLLIDADLRSPTIHRLFDLPLDPGVCEVLRAEAELDDVIRPTRAAGLWMISAGQCCQESVQLLAHEAMQAIFDRLRPDFDFIIIDGAPVLALPDSLLIGQHTDAAILSVMRDVSQAPKVYEAAERLRSVGVRVFGTVVHGMKPVSQRRALDLPAPAGR